MDKNIKEHIYYFTQVHNSFPSKFANNIQVLNMCKGFENNGKKVTLVNALCRKNYFRSLHIKKFIKEILGTSTIKQFSWIKFHYPFPWFKQLIYAVHVLIYTIKKKVNLSYTRSDLIMILFLLSNKKAVYEGHDAKRKIWLRLLAILMKSKRNRKKSKIVVITNELKKRFIEMGIPPKTILVEPDAVDLDRFNISYDMSQLRSELRLPIKKHIITYAGSLQYGRGIEVIIECAKKMENIMFIIIGGKSEKVLSRYRNITNKINNIIFRGFVNQELIVKYLSASDILLMPHTEQCDIIKYTSPMKMFEYMASKKPIISSDLPVIREILNEKNALLISPSDSKAMGKAISNILSNKDYAKSLVSQAYKDVQNHTWIKRARRINRFMDHYD